MRHRSNSKLDIKSLIILRNGKSTNITIDDGLGHIASISNHNNHTTLMTYEALENGDYNTYSKNYAYRSFSYIIAKYIREYKHIESHDVVNSDINSYTLPYIFSSNAPFSRINIVSYVDWINQANVIMITDPFTGARYLCTTLMMDRDREYLIFKYNIDTVRLHQPADIVYYSKDSEHFFNSIVYDILLNNYGYPYHYGVENLNEFNTGRYITISDILYKAIINHPTYMSKFNV
jgi:hypothetical protein